MSELVTIIVDGRELRVHADQSLAAALLNAGLPWVRRSVCGEPRVPVCGMGACFECRVRIDGATVRACLQPITPGMRVSTEAVP